MACVWLHHDSIKEGQQWMQLTPATPSEHNTVDLCTVALQHIAALALFKIPHHCQIIA